MNNLESIVSNYCKKFNKNGIPDPLREVRAIIQECTGLSTFEQILKKLDPLSVKKYQLITKLLKKRSERIPFGRIFNKSYFRDLELKLSNDNFIPRIDSEIIVDYLIDSEIKFSKIR